LARSSLKILIHRAGVLVRSVRRRFTDRRAIALYLQVHTVRGLQIGTGPNPIAGWLNTDRYPDTYPELRDQIVLLDATKRFPLADMSLDYVISEHQVEHISEGEVAYMLRECFRVLRAGGRLRIATPDLSAVVKLHEADLDDLGRHYLKFMTDRFIADASGNPSCHVINHMFYAHGHRFIYDFETLSARLVEAGFEDVVRHEPGASDVPALRGLEAHGRAVGDESVNRYETMVLEAVRPSP
jgi:predicted SAM-dependent methyltransferase